MENKTKHLRSSFQRKLKELHAITISARNGAKFTSLPVSLCRMTFWPRRRVLCDKKHLRPSMVLSKIFAVNRYYPVFSVDSRFDFAFDWSGNHGRPVINEHHVDNKKWRVAKAWEKVAKYPLTVDPTKYSGLIVEKSEANATHDGRVIQGPISSYQIKKGKNYQILIDNSEKEEVIDMRTPIFRGKIPLVYIKRRPINDRFSNKNSGVELREPNEVFTDKEQEQLVKFARIAGIDYGEVDVLRDNNSGKIYVVDSTNGPAGPPNGLAPADAITAIKRLAVAFDVVVEEMISEVSNKSLG